MTSEKDKLGNTLQISYTESGSTNLRIQQITDGAGRVYAFSYSSSNLLSSVVYRGAGNTDIETVSYTYSSSRLSTVTYADKKNATYGYADGKLTEARDILRTGLGRCKLTIAYGGTPAKVKSIKNYDGETLVNSVELRYGDHTTKVTDNAGRWCSYQFNNWGNTTSVYNQAGQALYGRYMFKNMLKNTKSVINANTTKIFKGREIAKSVETVSKIRAGNIARAFGETAAIGFGGWINSLGWKNVV